jgi:hypothetical protein
MGEPPQVGDENFLPFFELGAWAAGASSADTHVASFDIRQFMSF